MHLVNSHSQKSLEVLLPSLPASTLGDFKPRNCDRRLHRTRRCLPSGPWIRIIKLWILKFSRDVIIINIPSTQKNMDMYGCFLKWWHPTTMGFPTKNDHFGMFWRYHHLRKHPYKYIPRPKGKKATSRFKICRLSEDILVFRENMTLLMKS